MDARQLAQHLALDAEGLCRLLLPNGHREGHEWRAGDVHGASGKSLGVRLTGDKAGVWSDFSSGEAGDLLDLWAAARGVSFKEAYQQALAHAGVQPVRFEPMPRKSYRRPDKPRCGQVRGDALAYLTETRGLSMAACDAYRVSLTPEGEIVFPLLVNSEFWNAKYLRPRATPQGKNGWRQESGCEPCLFGWQAIPDSAKAVVITEGEIDALSCWDVGFPALSLPSGAKNLDWIESDFERLERFSHIVLCLDQDGPGQDATKAILARFDPVRVRVAKLPLKDANEMVAAGRRDELVAAIKGARSVDPVELRNATDYLAEMMAAFDCDMEHGWQLPFFNSRNVLLRMSELSLWTGINGHGKSQVLGHVMVHLMGKGERVCIFSGEMKPVRLLDRMVKQATTFGQPAREVVRRAVEWLGQTLWLFDVTGNTKADRILDVFLYARKRYGIRWFVIDSLAKCGIDEDDYRGQKQFVDRLCDFKNNHDCHVALVVPPRKVDDEYRKPGKLDVKGTGAITDMADTVFSIWRNKRKEEEEVEVADPEKRQLASAPDADLTCSKQRNGDWEGKISLAFDRSCYQYLPPKQRPINYAQIDLRQPAPSHHETSLEAVH